MPRPAKNLICAAALMCGGAAFGEDAPSYAVDSVYDLAWIRDIALDGSTGTVLLTMSNRVLAFETFPVKVTADVSIGIEGITSVVTGDNTLLVMGDDPQRGFTGGSILIYPEVDRSLESEITPLEFPLAITPFSEAVLTEDNQLFAVNPTWFSIIQASVDEMVTYLIDETQETFYTIDLFLQCGTASNVSLFEHEERTYYVTSITGSKLIELGPVELNVQQLSNSECFNPQGSSLTKSTTRKAVAERGVQHDLVDNPWAKSDASQVPKSLLTFDPDNATLSMFPIREFRKRLTIPRSESRTLDLTGEFKDGGVPAGRFGLMASSDDGGVIFVSYTGAQTVHRARQIDGQLEYLGKFDFNKPIKQLEVSADGELASIVIGDVRRDVQEELVLIKSPASIPASEPLTRQRFSVSNVQELLKEKGFDLKTDGIYGQNTQQAVQTYLQDASADQVMQTGASSELGGGTRGMVLNAAPTTAAQVPWSGSALVGAEKPIIPNLKPTLPINKTLRGLFPLR